jgi:hypothetical protein
MALSRISELSCKLLTLQKDLRLAINMSDSVDQPLHVGAAVNEVSSTYILLFAPTASAVHLEKLESKLSSAELKAIKDCWHFSQALNA